MKPMEWLALGDPAVKRLSKKYLLGKESAYPDKGLVRKYRAAFDPEKDTWGGGLYSPKWVSGTYTLLELIYMEADPREAYFRDGAYRVVRGVWQPPVSKKNVRATDMCVAGMLLRIAGYARLYLAPIGDIVDYILAHQMADGGWNCEWDSRAHPSTVGSVHTTLSVLEGFAEYEKQGFTDRLDEIHPAVNRGREFLLKRDLFKDRKTGLPLHPDMVTMHYPCRWKYDCFRALEYFADAGFPYDSRMADAVQLTRLNLLKGYAPRGKAYSGRTHCPLETGKGGRFNTLRALKILKAFDREAFIRIMNTEYKYPD